MDRTNAASCMKRISTIVGLLVLLGGCTTLYEGKYDFRDGWRKAKVAQVAAVSDIARPTFFECIRAASPQVRESQPFAVVTYKRFWRAARRAVPLASDSQVHVGDTVYLNLSSCEEAIAQPG